MATATFKINNVHCPSCTMMIQMTAEELDGVSSASADHVKQIATAEYDPETIDPQAIAVAIQAAGYGAEVIV